MGHRHPGKLNNAEVEHGRARWMLRVELAGCEECREEGDGNALHDLAPGGIFDALLRGYVLAKKQHWTAAKHRRRYPAMVYEIAPDDQRRAWNIPTRECMRLCVLTRNGSAVESGPVLEELRSMTLEERGLVLDDVIDGLAEEEV